MSTSPNPDPDHSPPADLTPGEEGVAQWFSEARPSAPPVPPEELETLVLDSYVEEGGGAVVGGPVAGRRSRAWHGALVAVVVLLLGVAGLVWASHDAARRADAVRADVLPPRPMVIDDPTVPLYPGMETFGGSGSGRVEDGEAGSAPPEVR